MVFTFPQFGNKLWKFEKVLDTQNMLFTCVFPQTKFNCLYVWGCGSQHMGSSDVSGFSCNLELTCE